MFVCVLVGLFKQRVEVVNRIGKCNNSEEIVNPIMGVMKKAPIPLSILFAHSKLMSVGF